MIDAEWLRDFAFRCSRQHRIPDSMLEEAWSRVDEPKSLMELVLGLAQVCAELTRHAYAHAGVPTPEFYTVGGPFLENLPDDQSERDRSPHFAAAQIVIALCNDDSSIAVPLVMAACLSPDRPTENHGFAVALAIMAQLHYVCQHFTPQVGTLR